MSNLFDVKGIYADKRSIKIQIQSPIKERKDLLSRLGDLKSWEVDDEDAEVVTISTSRPTEEYRITLNDKEPASGKVQAYWHQVGNQLMTSIIAVNMKCDLNEEKNLFFGVEKRIINCFTTL